MEEEGYIGLGDCRPRRLYRLQSRNLILGVYDGKQGFIGVREKMGSRYLFTEYHWDQGPPYGTAFPLEDLGPIPAEIELKELEPTIDQRNGRPVAFDRPKAEGGRGWYYLDDDSDDDGIEPGSRTYRPLFEYLEERERELAPSVQPGWGTLGRAKVRDEIEANVKASASDQQPDLEL